MTVYTCIRVEGEGRSPEGRCADTLRTVRHQRLVDGDFLQQSAIGGVLQLRLCVLDVGQGGEL